MSEIGEVTGGSLNPRWAFATLGYKWRFLRDNPTYFYPAGIWVFCGPQGCGKTLSAVATLQQLSKRYPKARIISNLEIHGLDTPVEPFVSYDQLSEESNGTEGIIFFLDEIHVLWNSLESKNIPITDMACFCQMRKDRRVIIGTSQVYNRIAKPIREQLQYIIKCQNYWNLLQVNEIIDPAEGVEKDGHIQGQLVKKQYFWHRPDLYAAYDTLTKINRAERG